MNDRYMFRGKTIEGVSPHFVIGHFVSVPRPMIVSYIPKIGGGWDFDDVDPTTVGQCSGLRDEDKKLIFESDILQFVTFDYNGADTQHIGIVYWSDGAFWIDCVANEGEEGVYSLGEIILLDDCAKIIGNIHDNPEYFKEQSP